MYVIDGMMHNTIVKSDMHAVDTHGVTLLTFAAMHFLGIFFGSSPSFGPGLSLSTIG
jgi:Tn3 transposase DDE domain-containing protein